MNFVKFLGTPILKNIYEQLLLHLKYYTPTNNTAKVEQGVEYVQS